MSSAVGGWTCAGSWPCLHDAWEHLRVSKSESIVAFDAVERVLDVNGMLANVQNVEMMY